MTGALGALLFLLAAGALTAGLVLLLLRGLGRAWAESRRNDALARQEGWRHLGSGVFTGPGGENDWRGGPQQDSDSGEAWTDFKAGLPGLRDGGFIIVPRSLGRPPARTERPGLDGLLARGGAVLDRRLGLAPSSPADDPHHWPELTLGSPAFRSAALVLASDPAWAAVLTPAVEALWLAAHPPGAAPIRLQALDHRLLLTRDDGRQPTTPEGSLALLRLGSAVLAEVRGRAAVG